MHQNAPHPAAPTPSPAADPAAPGQQPARPAGTTVWDFEVRTNEGEVTSLAMYRGKAVLVVNTASRCGFTSQYKDLQQIYTDYASQGFAVLAFPSNDFGGQEPGSDAEIKQFCEARYETTFPLFAKVKVKGAGKIPLYKHLTEASTAAVRGEVGWNFTKFLLSPEGVVIARFAPSDVPTAANVRQAIEATLPRAR